ANRDRGPYVPIGNGACPSATHADSAPQNETVEVVFRERQVRNALNPSKGLEGFEAIGSAIGRNVQKERPIGEARAELRQKRRMVFAEDHLILKKWIILRQRALRTHAVSPKRLAQEACPRVRCLAKGLGLVRHHDERARSLPCFFELREP